MGYQQRTTDMEPMRKEEYEAAQAEQDVFYVPKHSNDSIHLHRCQHHRSKRTNMRTRTPEAVPFGYADVCKYCCAWWRDTHGE